LFEKAVVDQHAAIFQREQIGAAAGGKPDFQAPAGHFGRCLADRLIFADLALFELSYPDLSEAFSLEQPHILLAQNVSLCQ
jgi:hypothetical protein